MKRTRGLTACVCAALYLFAFAGCAHPQTAQPANELHFDLDGITDVTLSYDEETITFFEGGDKLVIKEYMTSNKAGYYAKVVEKGGSIHVSEGGKPLLRRGFTRYVEVYWPSSYHGALTVTTTDGDIQIPGVDLVLTALRTDSTAGTTRIGNATAGDIHLSTTSGKMELGVLRADNLRLDSTSGSVVCASLIGSVTYASTSGSLEVASAIGSGSYAASNSGVLDVTYAEVTGDLSLRNKNEDVILALPAGLAFEFTATTKNGSVNTSFPQSLITRDRKTSGTIGANPTVHVAVETTNGNIEVTQ